MDKKMTVWIPAPVGGYCSHDCPIWTKCRFFVWREILLMHDRAPGLGCPHYGHDWGTTYPSDGSGGFFITCRKCGCDLSDSITGAQPECPGTKPLGPQILEREDYQEHT